MSHHPCFQTLILELLQDWRKTFILDTCRNSQVSKLLPSGHALLPHILQMKQMPNVAHWGQVRWVAKLSPKLLWVSVIHMEIILYLCIYQNIIGVISCGVQRTRCGRSRHRNRLCTACSSLYSSKTHLTPESPPDCATDTPVLVMMCLQQGRLLRENS